MIIVGDETHSNGRLPWVTGGLIVVNVLAFLLQRSLGEKFTYGYSLVPAEIATGRDLVKPQEMKIKVPYRAVEGYGNKRRVSVYYRDEWIKVPQYRGPRPIYLTLLSSMFLHVGWFHLIGNIWFLGVFGRNVETALGHGRFLAYYLICGVAGGLAHTLSDVESVIPCLGASGAISGVMGSYLAILPLNKVKIWLGWLWGVIDVPAFLVLGVWFAWQYVCAFAFAEMGRLGGGVAYWDHLGGFVAGMFLIAGTIAYLKWQIARIPQEEEAFPPVDREVAPSPADPFRACLPASEPANAKNR
jgi:membrane associated rhomboid family serine protease